jgi:hypothetical protein
MGVMLVMHAICQEITGYMIVISMFAHESAFLAVIVMTVTATEKLVCTGFAPYCYLTDPYRYCSCVVFSNRQFSQPVSNAHWLAMKGINHNDNAHASI